MYLWIFYVLLCSIRVRAQIAVLKGKGALVSYAQTLLSMCLIKLKLVLKLMQHDTQFILLRSVTFAPETTNMCLTSMKWLHFMQQEAQLNLLCHIMARYLSCSGVVWRDGWLKGPTTCVWLVWIFLRISFHSGCTGLQRRAEHQ